MQGNLKLLNKRILFLSPTFFGYENNIIMKMKELGAIVDYFDERAVQGAFNKAILKFYPPFFRKRASKYYNEILEAIDENKYDYVLVIKGGMIPPEFLLEIRNRNPNAYMSLYLWDSVKNIPKVEKKFKYFNQVYSFDPHDVSKYEGLILRPLFFCDDYRVTSLKNPDSACYDLGFLGTIHSDRYRILKEIEMLAEEKKWKIYMFKFLQGHFLYYIYKIYKREFWITKKSDFDYNKLSAREIAQVVSNTTAIIDIEHPKQMGLTMRTIEMIGMNKKLITTNKSIVEYDFYNKENIMVIPRKNITIPNTFFERPYQKLQADLYEKYSIGYWVQEVLGLEDRNGQ